VTNMIKAVERGGGVLVAAWGAEADELAVFTQRYPTVKIVKDQDEILDDASLTLVLSSQIANERAGIGVRAMQRGKDFLADKPGITTLEDLALIRRTLAQTARIYAILYSERLEVPAAVHAGELIKRGAIGKQARYIDCSHGPLPFGPQFVADIGPSRPNSTPPAARTSPGCQTAAVPAHPATRDTAAG
jgi:predicted dehydrogenase